MIGILMKRDWLFNQMKFENKMYLNLKIQIVWLMFKCFDGLIEI